MKSARASARCSRSIRRRNGRFSSENGRREQNFLRSSRLQFLNFAAFFEFRVWFFEFRSGATLCVLNKEIFASFRVDPR
jgi:hypothetical protein